MTIQSTHTKQVEQIQKQMKDLLSQKKANGSASCISPRYYSRGSFTMRTKDYKKNCYTLDCGALNNIIQIDPLNRIVTVEPRITMEELVRATLPYGLTIPVVPEFKSITVGGAIMGMAGESASHRWGCFNDSCIAFDLLLGDGSVLRATPFENEDVFYGIAGSYGSLGILVSVKIQLAPIKEFVHLRYTPFSNPLDAIQVLRELASASKCPDFLDGIVFTNNLAVVVEGNFRSQNDLSQKLPIYSPDLICSPYYYQHVNEIALSSGSNAYEELMTLYDYFFRYDRCAYWMGTYLFHFPLLTRLIGEGIFKVTQPLQEGFSADEIKRFQLLKKQNIIQRAISHPFMTSRFLGKLLHGARSEKWVQERFIIQDFCIPEINASQFLVEVMVDPALFPIWLLPIKGTRHSQIFAPHLLVDEKQGNLFINMGLYGLPSYSASIGQITKNLEKKTEIFGGRKVLYARSYYTQEEFWEIYSRDAYRALREKTDADGVFHEITKKVLSI